jgi:tetratricopeptide (TPR) repeat protein
MRAPPSGPFYALEMRDIAESTSVKIEHSEMLAWNSFAQGKQAEALANMRTGADLQDKVGHPEQALAEYEVALKLRPNRFNGLYNSGRAAAAAGNGQRAGFDYAALLKSTGNGQNSSRPEFAHARTFVSSGQTPQK